MGIALQAPGCQLGPGLEVELLGKGVEANGHEISGKVDVTSGKVDVRGNIVRSWQKLQMVL